MIGSLNYVLLSNTSIIETSESYLRIYSNSIIKEFLDELSIVLAFLRTPPRYLLLL